MKKGLILFTTFFALFFILYFGCEQTTNNGKGDSIISSNSTQETSDYFVNNTTGLDTNNGLTPSTAFKTITYSVATAGTYKKIKVAPGVYNVANGETFPITLKQGQSLIGDIVNKGAGSSTTEIKCTNTTAVSTDPSNSCIVTATNTIIKGFIFGNTAVQNFVYGIYSGTDLTVDLSNNTFDNNLYGGIYFDSGNLKSENNDFYITSMAYYLYNASLSYVLINNNTIKQFSSIPINIVSGGSNNIISNNIIIGNGQCGIQVQNGNPMIQNNTFNNASGYTYGAVYSPLNSSAPKIRSNTFICTTAIMAGNKYGTSNSANPDIGTSGDNGNNNFNLVTGAAIVKNDNNIVNVYAIGNTWPGNHYPPTTSDIVVEATGDKVYYGVGISDYITR